MTDLKDILDEHDISPDSIVEDLSSLIVRMHRAEEKLDRMQADEEYWSDRFRFAHHVPVEVSKRMNVELAKMLPVPRVQMTLLDSIETHRGPNDLLWITDLVYCDYVDSTKVEGQEFTLLPEKALCRPLDWTATSSGKFMLENLAQGKIEEPWRGAFHLRWNAQHLGLRCFKVYQKRAIELGTLEQYKKLKRGETDERGTFEVE